MSYEASRATAAYRAADRLDRLDRHGRHAGEWRRICRGDMDSQKTAPFRDIFDTDTVCVEDAEFIDIVSDNDHRVRAAYLLSAVFFGTVCMLVGSLIAL